jgi:hypothetical protein
MKKEMTIWVAASKAVDQAFEEGVLATQGVYALCRHPAIWPRWKTLPCCVRPTRDAQRKLKKS